VAAIESPLHNELGQIISAEDPKNKNTKQVYLNRLLKYQEIFKAGIRNECEKQM
jgi:hypothetical protein